MTRLIQVISGLLLTAGFIVIALVILTFCANGDYRLTWSLLSSNGLFGGFDPWCGLAFSVLAGVFLFLSISPRG